uniref:Uncharacterized protein n=1 Tax=Davidia involucrata TaxID=16924 RepID=A0A5B6YQF5_DAVIN
MRNLSTKLRGTLFYVLLHAFFTGGSAAFVNITRQSILWRKLRKDTRISSLIFPSGLHSSEAGGSTAFVNITRRSILWRKLRKDARISSLIFPSGLHSSEAGAGEGDVVSNGLRLSGGWCCYVLCGVFGRKGT